MKNLILLFTVFSMVACTSTSHYRRGPSNVDVKHTDRQDYSRIYTDTSSDAYKEIMGIQLPEGQRMRRDILDRYEQLKAEDNLVAVGYILEQVRVQPIELFKQLRTYMPVLELELPGGSNMFLVSRDESVREALLQPKVFSVADYRDRMQPSVGEYMLNRDVTQGQLEIAEQIMRGELQGEALQNAIAALDYYNLREKMWMRRLLSADDYPRIRQVVREKMQAAISERTSWNGELELTSQISRVVPVQLIQDYMGFGAPLHKMQEWSFKTQDSFFHNVGYFRGYRGSIADNFLPNFIGTTLFLKEFAAGDRSGRQRLASRVHADGIGAGQEMHEFLKKYIRDNKGQLTQGNFEDLTILGRMLRLQEEEGIDLRKGAGRLAINGRRIDQAPRTAMKVAEDGRIRTSIIGGLVGAIETSNAAIVQSINYLLKKPEHLRATIAAANELSDSDSIHDSDFANHVWEALRFHPINPFVVRTVEKNHYVHYTARNEIGSTNQVRVEIPEGARVLLATHSAMHDPRTVFNPDEFNADRNPQDRRMNLGFGLHRCLGDYVSEVMIPEIVRQIVVLPGLERVDEDEVKPAEGQTMARNQGIDFGRRDSFPESFKIKYDKEQLENQNGGE